MPLPQLFTFSIPPHSPSNQFHNPTFQKAMQARISDLLDRMELLQQDLDSTEREIDELEESAAVCTAYAYQVKELAKAEMVKKKWMRREAQLAQQIRREEMEMKRLVEENASLRRKITRIPKWKNGAGHQGSSGSD
ncbi:hypothetical protein G7Y89_g13564 [Cudoniella acicularis]|uniref:Uncharacterized protein n=1 Tax=Cudoniella acicularis TaxID=354080 RepID=A0A8H4R915_9HELO|nr:hypothetical protein G7Y89_g13564 [Cudoniella acicularis]